MAAATVSSAAAVAAMSTIDINNSENFDSNRKDHDPRVLGVPFPPRRLVLCLRSSTNRLLLIAAGVVALCGLIVLLTVGGGAGGTSRSVDTTTPLLHARQNTAKQQTHTPTRSSGSRRSGSQGSTPRTTTTTAPTVADVEEEQDVGVGETPDEEDEEEDHEQQPAHNAAVADEDESADGERSTPAPSKATTTKKHHSGPSSSSSSSSIAPNAVERILTKEALLQPSSTQPTILAKSDVDAALSATSKFLGMPPQNKETRLAVDADLLRVLPQTDYASDGTEHHRTCAIVGNSGTLLKSNKGRDIDAHDAVLRMNYAPTKGFEGDVGSKTTYDLSNRENARFLLKGEIGGDSRRGGHGLRPATLLFFEVASPINRRAIFNPLIKKFPAHRIHFLHPSFVARSQRLWFALKHAVEETKHAKFHDKPMSGLYAVLFALTVCDEVDMYGFEAYTSKKMAAAPYHYFDRVQGVTSVHSFDLAIEIFRALGAVRTIRIK